MLEKLVIILMLGANVLYVEAERCGPYICSDDNERA